MANNIKKIQIKCPECDHPYAIDLPMDDFNKYKEKGIVTINLVPPCKHALQMYVDANLKFRGGQVADLVINADDISEVYSKIQDENDIFEEEEDSDIIQKLTSDIIISNAKDCYAFKLLGAEEKVDIAELALISGDLEAARIILSDLAEFSSSIDDHELAESLKERVNQIDLIWKPDETKKWSDVLEELNTELDPKEKEAEKKVQLKRLDGILLDIRFANIKGEIANQDYEMKRDRLVAIKNKIG